MDSLVTDTLAQLRREKVRKLALVITLGVASTVVLVLGGLWVYPNHRLPLDSFTPSLVNNTEVGAAVPNVTPFKDLDDYQHRPDNQRDSTFAQQLFGPNVRSGSLGPYSHGGVGPQNRFAYVFYATKKEYLCNVLINFELLRRFEVAGEFALIYPKAWEREGPKSAIRQMLDKARDKYKANLHPMDLWSTHHGDPTWSDSLTKLYVFGMTDYTRIIYLDSDGLVLNNLDHLFIAPQARIALPRAYWLEEGKLASHIMVITPSQSLMDRVKAWVNTGGSAVGFDMEVVNKLSASSSLILPHRGYAMLTGEFRNTNHSRYLAEDGPDAEWNPHAEMAALYYIHFSDWPLPKPWIDASKDLIEKVQPACDPKEQVSCWNREHWHSVYQMYRDGKNRVCIN